MKKHLLHLLALFSLLFAAGCTTPDVEKLPSEDIEVLTRFKNEIAVLHSDLPPNSAEKYRAAKTLAANVDFSFTRQVSTLDQLFSSVDARVDKPRSINHMITFYYQHGDRSIRFVFYRYNNYVTSSEIIEK
jgi:hypothetical protein